MIVLSELKGEDGGEGGGRSVLVEPFGGVWLSVFSVFGPSLSSGD